MTIDTYDQLPPDSARVKLFRWSHGGSVDGPREIVFEDEAAYDPSSTAEPMPLSPSARPMPAEESTAEPENGSPVEILPPPPAPAPPSEMEDSGFPVPNDALGSTGQEGLSSELEEAASKPLVSITYSENLDDPEAGLVNSPNCSLPQEFDPLPNAQIAVEEEPF
jgi:hypothetical protein